MAYYYATTTSLSTLMVGTTFDTATTSLAQSCIVWAENEVNKYLSKRYDISSYLTSTAYATLPPLITSWTEQIATGHLYIQMSRGGKESISRGKEMRKMALENLKAIAEFEMDLLDSTGSVVSDKSTSNFRVLSSTSEYSPTFNEDDPKDWKVDKDKLDDIDSERD